jgi:hypothetical protein
LHIWLSESPHPHNGATFEAVAIKLPAFLDLLARKLLTKKVQLQCSDVAYYQADASGGACRAIQQKWFEMRI